MPATEAGHGQGQADMDGRTRQGEAREVHRVQLTETRTDRARRTARHGKATRRMVRYTQPGRRTA